MATRNVKDAKDLATDELIYFRSHAKATYMSDGSTVEDAIKNISNNSVGGSTTPFEIDLYWLMYELGTDLNLDLNSGLWEGPVPIEWVQEVYNNACINNLVLVIDSSYYHGNLMRDDGSSSYKYIVFDIYHEFTASFKRISISLGLNNGLVNVQFIDIMSTLSVEGGGTSSDLSNYYTKTEVDSKLSSKQSTLVSGTSIKTINGTSLLGSGNIKVGNKTLSTSTSSSMSLQPNIYYRNTSTSLSTLTITLASASDSSILNEYFVEFTTRSSGTTISLPSSVKWANGITPTFESGCTYQISIINNLGVCTQFK